MQDGKPFRKLKKQRVRTVIECTNLLFIKRQTITDKKKVRWLEWLVRRKFLKSVKDTCLNLFIQEM